MGVIMLLLTWVSCTEEITNVHSDGLKQIVITAPDFETEMGSRTNFQITNAGAEFSWAANDTVGIFPSEGAQAYFPMTSGAGTKTANFNGGGWALKDASTYAAYYPFIGDFYLDKNAVPVDYSGQIQTGDASTTHLGAYDYMVALPAAPKNGLVNFAFKHLGALVQLKLTIPQPATVNSVTLTTDDEVFTLKGRVNIMAENAVIESVATSNEMTLTVENVTTTEVNQVVTLYMMLPPVDLSSKTLKAVVRTTSGNENMILQSKNFQAGKAYALSSERSPSLGDTPKYVVYENLGSDNWDYLVVNDVYEQTLVKDDAGKFSASYSIIGNDTVHICADDKKILIRQSELSVMLICEDDSVRLYYSDMNIVSQKAFFINDVLPSTRTTVSNADMLRILLGEAVGKAIDEVFERVPVLNAAKTAIETLKMLYQTDDMTDYEKVDYILDGDYELIPSDWLNDMFGWADEEEDMIEPTYFIGIKTGTSKVDESTAVCLIDGYLRVEANDGEFDFEYGICCSDSPNPTVNYMVQKRRVISGLVNSVSIAFPVSLTFEELKTNITYYYRAYFKNNLDGRVEYADEIKSFKISDEPTPGEAIDLGLSVKWASHNVGASSPEDYGGYYAWGETEEKSDYGWDTYKYYNNNTGYINIGSNISGTQYDVAHVKWGGSWRMPTRDEIAELVHNCTWKWTTYNGVKGQLVTGPNGNSIFLPAAGLRYGTDLSGRGSDGGYWSATLDESGYSHGAYGLYFYDVRDYYYWYDDWSRISGFSVRPVTE